MKDKYALNTLIYYGFIVFRRGRWEHNKLDDRNLNMELSL